MRLLLEEPIRMRSETRALDELASNSAWLTKLEWGFTKAKDISVDFDITVNDTVHEAVLTFPTLFPLAPAYVRPRKPDIFWSKHQYPSTGTLCLEWGPDNWHPGVTGADLVVSTHKLLTYEEFGPALGIVAPSRHELTLGQRVRNESQRFLITQQLQEALESSSRSAPIPLAVGSLHRRQELVAVPTQLGVDVSLTQLGVPAEISDPTACSSWVRKGYVVWCDEWASLPKPIKDQTVLRDFLKAKDRWPWPTDEPQSGFLLLVDEQLRLLPLAVASSVGGSTAFEYFPVDCTDKGDVRQPERNGTLALKKVAIVGLGSVGSKVAVSLARSGTSRFLLIDDDILKPSNLTRNQLDWSLMGYDKVDAVQSAIQLIHPTAEVMCRTFRLAGQESSSLNTTVLEQIAACDLVIDATASPKVFSSIAAICTRRKVPVVWGEVFAGGIGALMARSLPGFDAEPLEIRRAIHVYLAGMPEAPYQLAQTYDAEEDHEVFVAGDAEISALSSSLTQFAIDALVSSEAPRFPNSAYLFGYQKAWIFEAPFDTHPIPCPRAVEVPVASIDSEESISALKELIEVFGAKPC
jgi:molybdopterin/thiamine biosynthesis adenylyltransferase